jgi:hypothetical protein
MCSMDSRVYIERPNAWIRVCSNVSLETAVHTGLIGPRRPQDWFLKRLQGWANPSSRGLWGGDAALHRCFWRCQRSTPAGQRSRWGEGREHHRHFPTGSLAWVVKTQARRKLRGTRLDRASCTAVSLRAACVQEEGGVQHSTQLAYAGVFGRRRHPEHIVTQLCSAALRAEALHGGVRACSAEQSVGPRALDESLCVVDQHMHHPGLGAARTQLARAPT